ncbi:MAG TPA: DUF4126 domain-containing protein [Ktedonobacteraceae bacterium]
MDIVSLGTPFGLAFASGLNAYLPLLALAVSVRWLHLFKANPSFSFITQIWFIVALVILTILDFVADKIPLIEHVWNAIHTVVRPIAGALVAAAAGIHAISGTHITDASSDAASRTVIAASILPITEVGLLIIFLLIGGVLAALSHTTKSITRFVSTITTAGFLNIPLSFLEDVLVFIAILLSLFVPAIMLALLVLFVLIVAPRLMRIWNR